MKKLIYLACPHAHKNKRIRQKRIRMVTEVTARLMSKGKFIFSPLTSLRNYF